MADLIVQDLTKEYPTRGAPLRVLNGCSLELSAGQNLAILGPSGSGKSTLLQIIGTLDQPTSGNVSLRGQNPFQLSEVELAAFRNRHGAAGSARHSTALHGRSHGRTDPKPLSWVGGRSGGLASHAK